jgi:hypothetical protein
MIVECELSQTSRAYLLYHIESLFQNYQIPITPQFIWESLLEEQQTNTLCIGWRGIITKKNYAILDRSIPSYLNIKILPKYNFIHAITDEIQMVLANHIYQSIRACLPYYHK